MLKNTLKRFWWLPLLLLAAWAAGYYSYYGTSTLPTPQLSLLPQKEVTIVAAGDIVCDDSMVKSERECHQDETAALVEKINPDAVLALGDLQYPRASLDRLENFYDKSWGEFKDKTYPVPGNHEYQLLGGANGYFDYFNGRGNFSGRAGDRDKGYYSFDLGNWHLIAINSNCRAVGGCGLNSAQYAWLKQDLEKNDKLCQLAFWHHPRFSSGKREENGQMQAMWELLYGHRADLVLAGHNHAYEGFAKQDPQRQAASNGVRQFVVGTGGRSFYEKTADRPNAEVYRSDVFGVLKLSLKTKGYDWEFLSDGDFTDKGSDRCS